MHSTSTLRTMPRQVRVAAVPMSVRDGDVAANLDAALAALGEAPAADVYLLPELCTTGYCGAAWTSLADQWTVHAVQQFAAWAHEARAVVCAPTLARREDGALVNRIWVLGAAEPVAPYDKAHLFAPLDEPAWLAPGREPRTLTVHDVPMGLSICYDLRFPAMYGRQARAGAMAFLVVAAWPAARHAALRALACARAAETQSWVIVCNRAGSDATGLEFGDGSLVASPNGEIVNTSTDEHEPVLAVVAADDVAGRRAVVPVLRDDNPAFDA